MVVFFCPVAARKTVETDGEDSGRLLREEKVNQVVVGSKLDDRPTRLSLFENCTLANYNHQNESMPSLLLLLLLLQGVAAATKAISCSCGTLGGSELNLYITLVCERRERERESV